MLQKNGSSDVRNFKQHAANVFHRFKIVCGSIERRISRGRTKYSNIIIFFLKETSRVFFFFICSLCSIFSLLICTLHDHLLELILYDVLWPQVKKKKKRSYVLDLREFIGGGLLIAVAYIVNMLITSVCPKSRMSVAYKSPSLTISFIFLQRFRIV